MQKDWVKIFETNQTFRAEIIKGMLLDNGINAVVLNHVDSSYLAALPGMAELYVHESQAAEAISILQADPENQG